MNESDFAIAVAFQSASDHDSLAIMNAMSQPLQATSLFFYILPCTWMEACLPFLKGKTERKPTEKIRNAVFFVTTEVSDDEETDESKIINLRNVSPTKTVLRRDIVHAEDFFLVGSNAWTVVSNKFGFDIEVRLNAVQHASTHREDSNLAVDLGHQKVIIPASGRFNYIVAKTDVVSDDEELNDLFPVAGLAKNSSASTDNVVIIGPAPAHYPSTGTTPKLTTDDSVMDYDEERKTNASKKRKRYGSGLGNLGNTCFMNSTLQCLAHTEPLRKYFVSGEYKNDLNLKNPLGTGGELATQFANLLGEMFGTNTTSSYNNVIYPRNFKYCLGKHAEQFVGYDQHDSQELATYLLDALHEDTNRITKKPYVEKPEQGEAETDDVAAEKAWNLHLKREDSKVLENFMGQVKSRVQCPKQGCGRVSTTFDPFMYLSVPIPGSMDRLLKVTYKPINGAHRKMTITVSKMATMNAILKKVAEKINFKNKTKIDENDLLVVEVWNNEVFSWYNPDDEIDKIRENDKMFVYELRPASFFPTINTTSTATARSIEIEIETRTKNRLPFLDLNCPHVCGLSDNDKWIDVLDTKLANSTTAARLTNPTRGSVEDRLRFYNQLESFLDQCIETSDFQSQLHDKDDAKKDDDDFVIDSLPSIHEVCSKSPLFHNVSTKMDISILEFIANKLRLLIRQQMRSKKNSNGVIVQVVMKNQSGQSSLLDRRSTDGAFTLPLCMRIPSTMTVYDFRKELACQLPVVTSSCEENVRIVDKAVADHEYPQVSREGCVETLQDFVLRQIPLSYERTPYTYKSTSFLPFKQLGMLANAEEVGDETRPLLLASAKDYKERELIADIVGPNGTVFLYWPQNLRDHFFDQGSWEDTEVDDDTSKGVGKTRRSQKSTTVEQCIAKYCQMEQLEETEMWYCSQCSEHVRAWKQFHLYRAPPILIVHLKRFQYSASTHRRDKIDYFIDFPLKGLDLTKEVMHQMDKEKAIYDCYAVSNHYGGLGGGHYTAYAMSTDGVWCHFDDSRVTTGSDPTEVISSAAYVLYYRRRDVIFDGKDLEAPFPAVVVGHTDNLSDTLVRDDIMDIDDKAVMNSPQSPLSTSPMESIVNNDDESDESVYAEPVFVSDDMPLQ